MNFQNQLDILNPEEIVWPITIIGLGGIGNPTAQILVGTGVPNVILMDKDTVETKNQPSQGYRQKDLGKLKVEAAKEIALEYNPDCKISVIPEFYVDQPLSGVVISAVDDIDVRKIIWEKIRWNPDVPLYIDGRLLSRYLEVHSVIPCEMKSIEKYEKTLFNKKDADEGTCTTKAIKYVGTTIGSIIASQVQKWIKGEPIEQELGFDFATMTFLKNKRF